MAIFIIINLKKFIRVILAAQLPVLTINVLLMLKMSE